MSPPLKPRDQKRPLKVMMVIDSLLPGGAESSLLSQIPGLEADGIEPLLVCLKRWTHVNLEDLAASVGLRPRFLDAGDASSKWYFKLPRWAWALRRMVKDERPDIVHSTLFQAGMTCRLGLIGTGVPLLSSLVNLDYSPERNKDPHIKGGPALSTLKLQAIRLINRYTAGLVTHFHAVTPAVKQESVRHLALNANRISVVFRGRTAVIPPDSATRTRIRTTLGLAAETKVLLNVGRHEYQKGQVFLIRAMAESELLDRDVKLLIAGRDGQATLSLKSEIQRLGLESRVLLLGHRNDVSDLLAISDVFLLPSLFEGAAGALLEAMAAVRPVVVSELAELTGLIDDDCVQKVQVRSPEELANAAAFLLDNPQIAQSLAQRGRSVFEDNFLLSRISSQMADLYRQVARRPA